MIDRWKDRQDRITSDFARRCQKRCDSRDSRQQRVNLPAEGYYCSAFPEGTGAASRIDGRRKRDLRADGMLDDGTASIGKHERSSGTVGGGGRLSAGRTEGRPGETAIVKSGARHARERESEARDERAIGAEEEGIRDSQLGRPAAWQKENRTGRRWRGEGQARARTRARREEGREKSRAGKVLSRREKGGRRSGEGGCAAVLCLLAAGARNGSGFGLGCGWAYGDSARHRTIGFASQGWPAQLWEDCW